MSIAEKLVEIAEDMPKVYAAGKQAAYDAFWDVFQNNGGAANYRYAFCYSRFDDTTFNPKYDIECTNVTTSGEYMFYSSPITDTKVGIYAPTTNINSAFRSSALVTIRLLHMHDTTTSSGAFSDCTKLKNITISGTIGKAIGFPDCTKLTHDSLMSIIEHLGTVTSTVTCTLGTTNLAKLSDTEKAIATQKGWTLA